MSVIQNADPSATNKYRDTTERSSKVMAGCSFYRFLCQICGNSKPVSGRKSLGCLRSTDKEKPPLAGRPVGRWAKLLRV